MVDYDLRALLPYIQEISGSGRDYLDGELLLIKPSDNGKQGNVRKLLNLGPSKDLSAEELADLIIREKLTSEEALELVNGLGRIAKTLVDCHYTFRDTANRLNQYGIPVEYKIPETIYIDL